MIKILLTIPLFISLQFSFVVAHWDAAYFRHRTDDFKVYNNWMKEIRDDTPLSELAIPGTHDSSTFSSHSNIVKTQAITFSEQLNYGIRFFDIRIRHTGDSFALHHDRFYLGQMFGDFLGNVSQFLEENRSETVLFRLKEDHKPNENNSRRLKDTLKHYLANPMYKSAYLQTTDPRLTMGDARGRYIIISDNYEFHDHGIPYWFFKKQDQYTIKTIWELYTKWEAVRKHLDEARNGHKSQFYINYLSASGGVLPFFVASGHVLPRTSSPRLSTGLVTFGFGHWYPDFPRANGMILFEGTNILTRDYLRDHPQRQRSAGVIVADFPGTDLIATIIKENF